MHLSLKQLSMKKTFLILLFLIAFVSLKAQYHLLYFSEDSIPKLKFDADQLQMKQKYEESTKIYRILLPIDTLRAYAYYEIAVNCYNQNKPDSSIIFLQKSIEFGYDSLKVFNKMVYVYKWKLKDNKKAYNLLTEMISFWPMNAKLYRERANYRDNADTEGYLSDLKKAGELGDKDAKRTYENFNKDKATLEKNLKAKGLK
jgi:hypothetical protein